MEYRDDRQPHSTCADVVSELGEIIFRKGYRLGSDMDRTDGVSEERADFT